MKKTLITVYWKLPVKDLPQTPKPQCTQRLNTNKTTCICSASCWWLPLFMNIRHMKFTFERIQRHHY